MKKLKRFISSVIITFIISAGFNSINYNTICNKKYSEVFSIVRFDINNCSVDPDPDKKI